MAALSLRLLGTFSAEKDGRPIRFGYDKMRGLLAYLAVERARPHRRQSLAALFWPEQDKRSALGSLSQALYRIRRALRDQGADQPLLCITTQTLQLNTDADLWIDAVEFTHLVETCRAHGHADLAACAPCLARLQRAAELYGGRFLAGIAVDDSPDFDEWLLMQRERYQRLAAETLQSLADSYEHREQTGTALGYARRRLELEPWHEEAHRQIMRLHVAAGERNAALAQYVECRRVLAAELAVEPSGETTALYARICDRDDEHQSTSGEQTLPTPLTPLIGRADELAALKARLAEPACRLITLVGSGGGGKTRLAVEAASQMEMRFSHGVTFVPLVSVDTADAMAPALAQALGFSLAGHDKAHTQVIDYLRRREMLLLLDNFEHLLDGLPLVSDILHAAPKVKILITSRAKLNAPGEYATVVSGLQIPQSLPDAASQAASVISDYGAVSLFLYHVHRTRPDYVADPAALDAIIHVCHLVSGMPLAIMLAAAWMDVLTPQEISSRLASETDDSESAGFHLLETDSSSLPERQRSMRAVFEHVWSLLTPREQRVFAALSVFRGGFTYDAAQVVARVTIRQVKGFADKSLLQRQTDGRYEIHELLRQYAREQLDARIEAVAVRDRHAAFFAEMAHRLGKDLQGSRQLEAVRAMDADADNLRIAWEWVVEHGQTALIDRALDGLCSFYDWRGYLQMADRMCLLARAHLDRTDVHPSESTHARLLTWHARFRRLLGHVDDARALLQRCLVMLDGHVEEKENEESCSAYAAALGELGVLMRDVDRAEADRLCDQSLALYRKANSRSGMADALHRRGELATIMGDYASALRWLEEGLALTYRLEDRRRTATVLWTLSVVYGIQGLLERGEYLGQQATAINKELGDRATAYHSLIELASLAAYAGRFGRARKMLAEACAASEELGARRQHALAVHLSAWINLNLGNSGEAQTQFRLAAGIFEELGDRHGRGLSCLGIGELSLTRRRFDAALSALTEAAAIFQALEQWDEYAITLSVLALAQRALGDLNDAKHSVIETLKRAVGIGAFAPAYMAVDAYSLIITGEGDVERAIEYHALVTAHPYFGNSEFRKAVTGSVIDEYASSLSPTCVDAAVERGRGRDIWAAVDEILAEQEQPV